MPSELPRIRALIVDDEPAARRGLAALLERHSDVELVGECRTAADIEPTVRATTPDLVFLDVQMPGGTGIEGFRRIPANRAPLVVMVTAFEEHALEAFDIEAVDYLLKPFTDDAFDRALSRVRRQLEVRHGAPASAEHDGVERIAIRSSRRVDLVDPAKIHRVDADGDYVRIHTAEDSYLLRETMGAMEDRLGGEPFVRIHRSTLVRADSISGFETRPNGRYVAILADGERRNVSTSGQERLARLLLLDL